MKLIYCISCGDIFSLDLHTKTCKCGKSFGKYINNIYAVVNGEGISLAISNSSLRNTVGSLQQDKGWKTREEYKKEFTVECWGRPNEGIGNPHTRIGRVE